MSDMGIFRQLIVHNDCGEGLIPRRSQFGVRVLFAKGAVNTCGNPQATRSARVENSY